MPPNSVKEAMLKLGKPPSPDSKNSSVSIGFASQVKPPKFTIYEYTMERRNFVQNAGMLAAFGLAIPTGIIAHPETAKSEIQPILLPERVPPIVSPPQPEPLQ